MYNFFYCYRLWFLRIFIIIYLNICFNLTFLILMILGTLAETSEILYDNTMSTYTLELINKRK